MGLYGVLVVTTPAIGATPAQAYPGVSYDADAVMLFSEIDAVQNRAVDVAVKTPGSARPPSESSGTPLVQYP